MVRREGTAGNPPGRPNAVGAPSCTIPAGDTRIVDGSVLSVGALPFCRPVRLAPEVIIEPEPPLAAVGELLPTYSLELSP